MDRGKEMSFIGRIVSRPAINTTRNVLLRGLAWLIVASMVGWYFRVIPMSLLDFNVSTYIPLIWHVVLNVVVWISSCVVMYAFALLINRNVSVVELFGRMLFAHYPINFIMIPGLLTGYRVSYAQFMSDPLISLTNDTFYAVVCMVFCLAVTLWYLYWGYVAYRECVSGEGVKGVKLIYLVGMVIAYKMSGIALQPIYDMIL